MKYVLRLITLIPFAFIVLISLTKSFITYSFNWIWYGGEAIAYTKDIHAKTIFDVYNQVVESNPKNFLNASKFKGNDRINHFLINALRQLSPEEAHILAKNLHARCDNAEGGVGGQSHNTFESVQKKFSRGFRPGINVPQ